MSERASVVTIVGARPQFIKAAMVQRAIRADGRVRETLIHTGQHYDSNMSDVFFDELGIEPPTHNLGIGSGAHGAQTGRMLEAIEDVLEQERPDVVIVYGDTNSTLAGVLAASKLHVPVAHVEAGLRSFNRRMPEEVNRIVADHISDILFAPTATAVANLVAEGVPTERVLHVGDVMYDAALHFGAVARQRHDLATRAVSEKRYAVCTVHRQENTDDASRLTSILTALQRIRERMPVVMPMHPRARQAVSTHGLEHLLAGITCTEPLSYLQMQRLTADAGVVLTDSGGLQKEAYFLQVPCVTLRDETEWVETVEGGWNIVAGSSVAKVVEAATKERRLDPQTRPFGDGASSIAIAHALATFLDRCTS